VKYLVFHNNLNTTISLLHIFFKFILFLFFFLSNFVLRFFEISFFEVYKIDLAKNADVSNIGV